MDSIRSRIATARPVVLALLVIPSVAGCDDNEVPALLPPMAGIAIGERHSCGLAESGDVYCWGDGSSGQLGTGATASESYAVPVTGAPELAAIVAGGSHTCGLTFDGAAWCWGANARGQAGVAASDLTVPTPRAVDTDLQFRALSAGLEHTCGIATDGTGWCWGRGSDGQLGTGEFASAVLTPLPVAGGHTFRAISAGARHTCGITMAGAAYCWGANELAQLGSGAEGEPEPAPVPVDATLTFIDISAGFNHSCAVATGGTPYCWGENRAGETGGMWVHVPDEPGERRPVAVTTWGAVYVAVSAGRFYTCGLRNQGEAMCWGRGAEGQLGNSGAMDYTVPQLVHVEQGRRFTPNNGIFTTIDAGGFAHACGISEDGKALCWGAGGDGQLGSGDFLAMIPAVVRLRGR